MRRIVVFLLAGFMAGSVQGQTEGKYIREGNKSYEKDKFDESEIAYRKALEEKKESYRAGFNLGNALYKQKKYDEATSEYGQQADKELGKPDKARLYHNIGNTMLQSGKLEESIKAYEESLRNNPGDRETKYNLSYAERLLKQQQQQQQQQGQGKDNKQDQDKNQQQQNKDQDKQDQQKQKDQNNQQLNQEDQKQQQQPQPKDQISREDAAKILETLANNEKKVMEKVNKMKAKAKKTKVEKEW